MADETDSSWDCRMVEHLAPKMEMSMARWSERSWESSKSPLTVDRMDSAMKRRSLSLLGCWKAFHLLVRQMEKTMVQWLPQKKEEQTVFLMENHYVENLEY